MAWHIIGTDLGPCSCDLGCPCILVYMSKQVTTRWGKREKGVREEVVRGKY
jgi:hypothetical protein